MSVIDDAIRAGCNATDAHLICSWPSCACKKSPAETKAILRAAYPREPDAATVEAKARVLFHSTDNPVWNARWDRLHETGFSFAAWTGNEIPHEGKAFFRAQARDAYRVHPLWVELWGGGE